MWLLRWHSGKESTCQCRKCRFDPWVGKIPWRRKWRPTPVFSPGVHQETSTWTVQRSLAGYSQCMGWQKVGYDGATNIPTGTYRDVTLKGGWKGMTSEVRENSKERDVTEAEGAKGFCGGNGPRTNTSATTGEIIVPWNWCY